MRPPPGLVVVGNVVVLSGDWLHLALKDAALATKYRRRDGVPETPQHREYVQRLSSAMTASVAVGGQSDIANPVAVEHYPQQNFTTVEEAAKMLGLSRRQTRRLALKLGGRICAGRWLLDLDAVNEHLEGRP